MEEELIEEMRQEIRDNLKFALKFNKPFVYKVGLLDLVFDPEKNALNMSRADLERPQPMALPPGATMSNNYELLEKAIATNIVRTKNNL